MDISILKNRIISEINRHDDDEFIFIMEDGAEYKMYHSQDCCESVYIEDVCGDLDDITGSIVFIAEESTSNQHPASWIANEFDDSFTWTFYKIDTNRGGVTIRWYGESNGYYSESVDFEEIKPPITND